MTISERKEYLNEHFMYEVKMLFFALRFIERLNKLKKTDENIMCSNLALEGFLLHARNLLEFFYKNFKKNSDRVSAWHFFDNEACYNQLLPIKTPAIEIVEKRVNNEITHLGVKRFSSTIDKQWDTVTILHDFMSLVKIFLDNLPGEYYSDELRKY